MRLIITAGLIFAFLSVFAQTEKDSLLKDYIQKTREQIAKENYSSAELYLKKIISMKATVPDEVAFLIGKTQLGQKNYVKARDAFQKYLDLTDNKGLFYSEALELKANAEKNICSKCNNTGVAQLKDTCTYCHGNGVYHTNCESCRGKGKQLCYVCSGDGVSAKPGPFGMVYYNCSHCQGKGVADCISCKGKGQKERFCELCRGKGYQKKEQICDHHP